jgi:DNA-sulfur modification-associated
VQRVGNRSPWGSYYYFKEKQVFNTTAPVTYGIPVLVMPFRDNAAVGVTTLDIIVSVLPNPTLEETVQAAKSKLAEMMREQRDLRDHAELRNEVQRFLKGSGKGRNAQSYANYLARGQRGELGDAWSAPPLTLWSPRPLVLQNGTVSLPPGAATAGGTVNLPLGMTMVPIDGETQVDAWWRLWNDPERYGLDRDKLAAVRIPFEIYWGISVTEARQVFRDRNLLGVALSKNLALGMDSRDVGTIVAAEAAERVDATDAYGRSFTDLIEKRKRQIGKNDWEWVTLSAWRGLAVTTIFGTPGIAETSSSLEADSLPEGVDLDEATAEAASAMAQIVDAFPAEFADRTAITAPAVLAGIGALAHLTMPWYKPDGDDPAPMTRAELISVLRSIKWAREPRYWEGVAAKRATTRDGSLGALSFAGGIKDSAHRVYDALHDPDSELGRKIRGKDKAA